MEETIADMVTRAQGQLRGVNAAQLSVSGLLERLFSEIVARDRVIEELKKQAPKPKK